ETPAHERSEDRDSLSVEQTALFDPWAEDARRAREARDAAMSRALDSQAADQDRGVIDQAIRHLARQGQPFSANDVRKLLPAVEPSLIGNRFMAAARRGLIEQCGTTQATHEAGHARLLRVWRGRQP